MWPNPQFPADLLTFTEKMLDGKLHFLCSVVQLEGSQCSSTLTLERRCTWTLETIEALSSSNCWWQFHYTIQHYFQTPLALFINICLNSSFFYEGIWKEWGSAIDFAAQLLDLPLIYLEIENLPWEVLSSWTCVIITRKNHTHSAKLSVSLVSLRYNLSIGFHVLETASIWLFF